MKKGYWLVFFKNPKKPFKPKSIFQLNIPLPGCFFHPFALMQKGQPKNQE